VNPEGLEGDGAGEAASVGQRNKLLLLPGAESGRIRSLYRTPAGQELAVVTWLGDGGHTELTRGDEG
jgi:hypothetical protein